MPVFVLTDELSFPPPTLANSDGILAVGGDLQTERLLLAYQSGIFPWYSSGEPIIWWSPDPRFVLYPHELRVAKSMRPVFNRREFFVTYDQHFSAVIDACKRIKRPGQQGTWITPEMRNAYLKLHKMGFAHSVEVWRENDLVGGLYGVSLGKSFFGESMFSRVSNASKVGFITLVQDLQDKDFALVDCQVYTKHLAQFGAQLIPRKDFLTQLNVSLAAPSLVGHWGALLGRKA